MLWRTTLRHDRHGFAPRLLRHVPKESSEAAPMGRPADDISITCTSTATVAMKAQEVPIHIPELA